PPYFAGAVAWAVGAAAAGADVATAGAAAPAVGDADGLGAGLQPARLTIPAADAQRAPAVPARRRSVRRPSRRRAHPSQYALSSIVLSFGFVIAFGLGLVR